jgi:hypothetical protein
MSIPPIFISNNDTPATHHPVCQGRIQASFQRFGNDCRGVAAAERPPKLQV